LFFLSGYKDALFFILAELGDPDTIQIIIILLILRHKKIVWGISKGNSEGMKGE
jgi:hypothetical protein